MVAKKTPCVPIPGEAAIDSLTKLVLVIRQAKICRPEARYYLGVSPEFAATVGRCGQVCGMFFTVVDPRAEEDAYPWMLREGEDWRLSISETVSGAEYITSCGSRDDLEFA